MTGTTTAAAASLSRSRHTNSSALPSVFFSRPKNGQTVRQIWCGSVRGALFHEISHKSKFVIYHSLCEYCVSW